MSFHEIFLETERVQTALLFQIAKRLQLFQKMVIFFSRENEESEKRV